MKILYIAGAGRSGSTILANILGEVEGFCSLGEVRHIWEGIVKGWFCGCGKPLGECAFWTEVFTSAFGGADRVDPARLRALSNHGLRSRHFAVPGLVRQRATSRSMEPYLEATAQLYRAICARTGSNVLIDSSKAAAYQYVLQDVLGLEVYTLHLVRDARAVAYAWWYRKKLRSPCDDDEYLDRYHPVETALRWYETNALLRRASARHPDRYMLLRYEDFVNDYERSLARILEWIGADASKSPLSEGGVVLGTHHTVSGNPDRFQSGTIRIKQNEEEWRRRMGYAHRVMVSAITWPELRRYRYSLI